VRLKDSLSKLRLSTVIDSHLANSCIPTLEIFSLAVLLTPLPSPPPQGGRGQRVPPLPLREGMEGRGKTIRSLHFHRFLVIENS